MKAVSMMGMKGDFKVFMAELEVAVEQSLIDDVAETVKSELAKTVVEEIYGAYDPIFKSRRGPVGRIGSISSSVGGMQDPNFIDAYLEGMNLGGRYTLCVESKASLQNLYGTSHTESLTPVVEKGDSRYNMPFPRPIHKPTEEALGRSGAATEALIRGLNKRGIKAERG